MKNPEHPIIDMLRNRADALAADCDLLAPRETTVRLARWMAEDIDRLEREDVEGLFLIGDVLLRERLCCSAIKSRATSLLSQTGALHHPHTHNHEAGSMFIGEDQ